MTKEEIMAALGLVKMDISICLSDIEPSHMTKSANGKIYCNLTVAKRINPDQWKRDVKVYQTQTKKEIDEHQTLKYVGAGKIFIFEEKPATPPTADDIAKLYAGAVEKQPKAEEPTDNKSDDLPF